MTAQCGLRHREAEIRRKGVGWGTKAENKKWNDVSGENRKAQASGQEGGYIRELDNLEDPANPKSGMRLVAKNHNGHQYELKAGTNGKKRLGLEVKTWGWDSSKVGRRTLPALA